MKLIDLTGQKFGRLLVLERAENRGKNIYWKCRCDCDKEIVVRGDHLKSGATSSCGCFSNETHTKHGKAGTPLYQIWGGIVQRCTNPQNPYYKNYGGRGVLLFPEWQNSFTAFYDYVSTLPNFGKEGYSLDRIDNNGNYEPNNVRWADRKTQLRNKRTNHIVEYNGVATCLVNAAEKSGINKNTLLKRARKGDTGEELFRPVRQSSCRR